MSQYLPEVTTLTTESSAHFAYDNHPEVTPVIFMEIYGNLPVPKLIYILLRSG